MLTLTLTLTETPFFLFLFKLLFPFFGREKKVANWFCDGVVIIHFVIIGNVVINIINLTLPLTLKWCVYVKLFVSVYFLRSLVNINIAKVYHLVNLWET